MEISLHIKQTILCLIFIFSHTFIISQTCSPNNIILSTQQEIDDFPINHPNCTEVVGNLLIRGNNITNLDGLLQLTTVSNSLIIQNCPLLVDTDGLLQLTTVGVGLVVNNCSSLDNLDGLANVTSTQNLQIIFCSILDDITGLSNITSIDGSLNFAFCPMITSLSSLSNVNSGSIGNMTIRDMNGLTDLTGLSWITSTSNGFCVISNNTGLQNIDALNNLQSIAGSLGIGTNPSLTSISGLSGLTSIGESLSIQNNDMLTNIDGLSNLASTSLINLTISGNPLLSNIDPLSTITAVTGRLDIFDFIGSDLSALSSLTTIGDDFRLSDNPNLTSISALSNLTSVGGDLKLSDMPNLSNISGLSNLTSPVGGDLGIYHMLNLSSISALSNITSIGGDLVIYNVDLLSSLNGLEQVTTINGSINISLNDVLTDISGISNIDPTTIQSTNNAPDLTIRSNPLLSMCDIANICTFLDLPNITSDISSNASGCEDAIAVQNACNNVASDNNKIDFDGVDDYISLINIPSSFTYSTEMWVKFDQVSNNMRILSASSNDGDIYSLAILAGNKVYLSIGGGGSPVAVTNTPINSNQWYHFALVRKSNTEIDFYLNGVQETTTSIVDPLVKWVDEMRLGSPFILNGNPNGLYFDGQIEEFRVWEGPLTQMEITNRMNTELSGSENNLVAYYKFDDDSSPNDIEDCQITPYHGIRIGANGPNNLPQFITDQTLTPTDIECDPCGCNPNLSPLIPNTNSGLHYASCKSDDGNYTHYCDSQGNLLLSLDSATGSLVEPSEVSINIVSGGIYYPELCIGTGGTQDGSCFISNPDGSAILCRTWDVNNTATNATIRYYFDDNDVDIINQELFDNGLEPFSDKSNMWFYKVINGLGHSKPDDLLAADVQLLHNNGIDGATTNNWVLGFEGSYYAEYEVASFSGGGGGGGHLGSSPICPAIHSEIAGDVTLANPGNTDVFVSLQGGQSPYHIELSDGTMVSNYISGIPITVSISESTIITLTGAIDANGCPLSSINGSAAIFIQGQDVTNPTAVCQDVTFDINNYGILAISAAEIDNGSSDDTGIFYMELNENSFECGYSNPQITTMTVYDANGNSDQCNSNITINDPNMVCCPNIKTIPYTPSLLKIYQAAQSISSDAEIKNAFGDTDILYRAGNDIELNQGFEVIQGALFEAKIGPCNN